MPRTGYISNMFGYSPIKPLQNHMQRVYETVLHLPSLFEAMVAEDWKSVKKAQKKVARGEAAADDMKREMRHHLPKGLFMAIDRRDVLDVLLMQDLIANQAKDVVGVILSRKISLPEDMRKPFLEFGQTCVDCVAWALDLINELDELLEAGFQGKEVTHVEEMINDLNNLESRTDKQQRKLQNTLFDHEEDMSPIDVMFTYKIIGSVGEIADYAQRVGSRLQLMIAR